MKKFKILFAFFALLIAMGGVFAFTESKQKKAEAPAVFSNWYVYTGDVSDLDEVKDASNYVYSGSSPTCSESDYICEILATGPTGAGDHPNAFNNTQKAELATAFGGGVVSGNIRMKD